jgi:hypothetical protein
MESGIEEAKVRKRAGIKVRGKIRYKDVDVL